MEPVDHGNLINGQLGTRILWKSLIHLRGQLESDRDSLGKSGLLRSSSVAEDGPDDLDLCDHRNFSHPRSLLSSGGFAQPKLLEAAYGMRLLYTEANPLSRAKAITDTAHQLVPAADEASDWYGHACRIPPQRLAKGHLLALKRFSAKLFRAKPD